MKKWRDKRLFPFLPLSSHTQGQKKKDREKKEGKDGERERSSAKSVYGRRVISLNLR